MTGYIIKRKVTDPLLKMSDELSGLYEVCRHGVYFIYMRQINPFITVVTILKRNFNSCRGSLLPCMLELELK
jgi:hypothetical protein